MIDNDCVLLLRYKIFMLSNWGLQSIVDLYLKILSNIQLFPIKTTSIVYKYYIHILGYFGWGQSMLTTGFRAFS